MGLCPGLAFTVVTSQISLGLFRTLVRVFSQYSGVHLLRTPGSARMSRQLEQSYLYVMQETVLQSYTLHDKVAVYKLTNITQHMGNCLQSSYLTFLTTQNNMISLTRQLDYLLKISFSWFTQHVNHGLLRIKQLSTQQVFKFRKITSNRKYRG